MLPPIGMAAAAISVLPFLLGGLLDLAQAELVSTPLRVAALVALIAGTTGIPCSGGRAWERIACALLCGGAAASLVPWFPLNAESASLWLVELWAAVATIGLVMMGTGYVIAAVAALRGPSTIWALPTVLVSALGAVLVVLRALAEGMMSAPPKTDVWIELLSYLVSAAVLLAPRALCRPVAADHAFPS